MWHRKGNGIMASDQQFSRNVAERQKAMFAMFVGQGLYTTRAALCAASGIPASTLQDWANGAAMPLHGALHLSLFLPAEAINMLCEVAGKRLVADGPDAASTWNVVAASAAGLTADICEAQRDGRIDHSEDARLRRRVREVIATAQTMVAGQ